MLAGFLSDVHGNYLAFIKALNILKSREVDSIYFLGDAIGYFDSDKIIRTISDEKISALRGNHEQMVLDNSVPPEKEKFYRLNSYVNSEITDIIKEWPCQIIEKIGNKKIHMVHGAYNNPVWGYTRYDTRWGANLDFNLFVSGATHRPFVKRLDDKIIANIGSCGFPRDHGKLGSIGVYDSTKNEFEIIRFCIAESISYIINTHSNLEKQVLDIFERKGIDE